MNEGENYYGEVKMGQVRRKAVKTGHDRLEAKHLSGQLSATLETLQPIHVGSGMFIAPDQLGLSSEHALIKEFFRAGKQLVIPGTSLKGAIRSLVEAFTHSCAPATREAEAPCTFERRGENELCPACRIFGALGFQGAMRFDEGTFLKGARRAVIVIPPQFEPKAHVPWRRYYPHEKVDPREQNWPLEVIQAGAKIQVRATFTNLTEAELGCVLIALGQGRWALVPKIGAGKSAGLGSVRVEKLKAETLDPRQSYLQFDPVWKPVDLVACLGAAESSLVRKDALEVLARDLALKEPSR